ncbi:MAG: hypothetical protein KGY38_06445 [Desulfobacterales bacterium]|nr:hypothetical protein [Desulfobacterales bacterium]
MNAVLIRKMVEQGSCPPGCTAAEVVSALAETRAKNSFEMWGLLSAKKKHASGLIEPLGLVSVCLVTTAFADYLVDALQDSTNGTMDAFSWHAMGTDSTAESNTDTTLGTEVESRTDGTQTEGSSTNIYQTVGTISATASHSIVEHGIFTASSGGTLLDRSVFSAISLTNGDSIEFTYELTVNAET